MTKRITSVLTIILLLATSQNILAQNNYIKQIEAWDKARIENLKAENGWLNLVDLIWLQEGNSSFGSSKNNKVIFPTSEIDSIAGYFERKGNVVTMFTANNVALKIKGEVVKEAILFHPDSSKNPMVSYGNLRWTIIKRDQNIGIRLRNLKSAEIASFKGIERFAADTQWIIPAILIKENQPDKILITNVLGQTNQQKSAGKLQFKIAGKAYSLDALEEGDELFIIFGDETSGKTTYHTGRFLYAAKPGADGKTILDFNKAFNPPCAFTDFATCPLPPKQNILPIEITAGEKLYKVH
jgi:uncharacterized protein (DUF1684 family)